MEEEIGFGIDEWFVYIEDIIIMFLDYVFWIFGIK